MATIDPPHSRLKQEKRKNRKKERKKKRRGGNKQTKSVTATRTINTHL